MLFLKLNAICVVRVSCFPLDNDYVTMYTILFTLSVPHVSKFMINKDTASFTFSHLTRVTPRRRVRVAAMEGCVICAHEIQFHAPCMIDGGIIQVFSPPHNLLLYLRDAVVCFLKWGFFYFGLVYCAIIMSNWVLEGFFLYVSRNSLLVTVIRTIH